jgi:hypothetical protein
MVLRDVSGPTEVETMSNTVPQLLTLISVSRMLCVSPHTVRAWVRKGQLQPIRLCRRLLFHPDEVTRFLNGVSRS